MTKLISATVNVNAFLGGPEISGALTELESNKVKLGYCS